MSIHGDIQQRIPQALKAHDEVLLTTLRSLLSQMQSEVIAKKRKPSEYLSDEEALVVIKRASNMRKDSITQFDAAGRTDLSAKERAELEIINTFLPAMMSFDEILQKVAQIKASLNITEKKDAGRLMGAVMKELGASADGAQVKTAVDSLL